MARQEQYVTVFGGDKATARSIHIPGESRIKCGLAIFGGLNKQNHTSGLGVRVQDKRVKMTDILAFCGKMGPVDLFSLYRGLLVALRLQELNDRVLQKALSGTKRFAHPQDLRDREAIIELIGQDIFDQIMQRVPDKIEDKLQLIKSHQYDLDTVAITFEVEAGIIAFLPGFKEYGVHTPEELKDLMSAQQRILERFGPHIKPYIQQYGLAEELEHKIEDVVYQAVQVGMQDELEITGLALYAALWNKAVDLHSAGHFARQDPVALRAQILAQVGDYLVRHFGSGSIEQHAQRLLELGTRFKGLQLGQLN